MFVFVVLGLCVMSLWYCVCCSMFVVVAIELCLLVLDCVCSCWFVFG